MRLDPQRVGEALMAAVTGNLDAVTAPDFEARLTAAVKPGEQRIILDFSGCDYISSAGLRVLLGIAKRLPKKDGGLFILSPSPVIADTLAVSGFENIVNVVWSLEDALAPA